MSDINVVQRTQMIVVDVASASVSVINTGPQGPTGASTASQVSVTDSGAYFTGSDLETILQEIGSRLVALETP